MSVSNINNTMGIVLLRRLSVTSNKYRMLNI